MNPEVLMCFLLSNLIGPNQNSKVAALSRLASLFDLNSYWTNSVIESSDVMHE